MFFADIPIWLVNAALWALLSLPFVVVGSSLYLAHKLEKPAWALYWMTREHFEAARAPAPLPRAEPNGIPSGFAPSV